MSTHETLEHQEHAQHAAGHGSKNAALLIAVLAALLALVEVQAKHAEIQVEEDSVSAADTWSQYQGKSIRQAIAHDLQRLIGTLDIPTAPDRLAVRQDLEKSLADDQQRYEKDPKDGKQAIARRAHELESARDETLERAHGFDNASASLELGIVLATASAITASKMLIRLALGLGVAGVALAICAHVAPSLAAF
jgi:hypothetical protein